MKRVIAVDFDGTLCENRWPEIGKPNSALISQLINERERGSKIILYTCRQYKMLRNAVRWCKEQGLEFDAVNRNIPERIKAYRGDTRKISADVYIDDRAARFTFGETLNIGGGGE